MSAEQAYDHDDLRVWRSEAAGLEEQIQAKNRQHEVELRELRERLKTMKDQMRKMAKDVDEIRRAPRSILPIAVTPEAYEAICEDADDSDVSVTAILRQYLKLGAKAAGSRLADIPMYPNVKRRRDFPRKEADAA